VVPPVAPALLACAHRRTQHAEAQPKACLVLFLFLPPLVYTSAWQTSWRELRASLWPILLPAIGLV
jgi:CPA1 family monovalent cation:H+ antiporter